MENNVHLLELKQLALNEDVLSVSREVNELKTRFEDYVLEEERKLQVAQLEATEKGEEVPEDLWIKPLKDAFYEVYQVYKDARNKAKELKNAEESESLRKKKQLIARLQETIEKEENIGAAFQEFKHIQEEWKQIGNVPREKREEIQRAYSKLIEDFFYQMNIYKHLKEHDLKRNQQLKEALIQRLTDLVDSTLMKEVEQHFKVIQSEWDEVGPVANEMWEELKEKYWSNVRKIHEKLNQYYDEKRNALLENLNQKKALLEKTKAIFESVKDRKEGKEYEEATKKILQIQNDWKAVGFGPRKENEEIWKEFRAVCDAFFDQKKEVFKIVAEKYNHIAEQKKSLIQKAEELKQSTEWKETAAQLKRLQNNWKQLGHAGHKFEQRLWSDFRAACDHFFNQRDQHFNEQESAFVENLEKKKALIVKVQSFALSGDKKADLAALKSFTTEFNEIGMVPLKEKDAVFQEFKKAIDTWYQALKLEGEEKESIFFQARLDVLASSEDPASAYRNEKFELRKQIDKLKGEIQQLENNLGFFAKSKGADALKKEVESKVNQANKRIETLKMRLKLIPNE